MTLRFNAKEHYIVINDDNTGTVTKNDITLKFTVDPETKEVIGEGLHREAIKAIKGRLSNHSFLGLQAAGLRGSKDNSQGNHQYRLRRGRK